MTDIRVTLNALIATKKAIDAYSRDIADVIAQFKSDCPPTGNWCDEDASNFQATATRLLGTVADLSNASIELSSRIEEKAELVRVNKTYRV